MPRIAAIVILSLFSICTPHKMKMGRMAHVKSVTIDVAEMKYARLATKAPSLHDPPGLGSHECDNGWQMLRHAMNVMIPLIVLSAKTAQMVRTIALPSAMRRKVKQTLALMKTRHQIYKGSHATYAWLRQLRFKVFLLWWWIGTYVVCSITILNCEIFLLNTKSCKDAVVQWYNRSSEQYLEFIS